jgi:hypothetical protein
MADRDPETIDWGSVFAQAVAIALKYTRGDAEEVVQEAMVLYFEGAAPWDASGRMTLPEHLVHVGLYERRKRERTERRRRHPKVIGKLVHIFDRPPRTAEEDFSDAEDEQRKSRLLDRLLGDFADDAQAREIVRLEQEGVHEPLEQAKSSGMEIEEVRNARKRIKRRVEAIAQRDEEATEP